MALFGKDNSTQQNGFSLAGNSQLAYIEPDSLGRPYRRALLPAGYAPLHTLPVDVVSKQLEWDDARGHPQISRQISDDQRRRIQSLFATQGRYIEPFPESAISKAIAISEEPPPVSRPSTQSTSASGLNERTSGLQISSNSNTALVGGIVFAAFLAWLFGFVNRLASGEKPSIGRQILVESASLVISGVVLYSFGIVDEIKLLSLSLGGGFSVAVISTIKAA
jgi:hypothetical protein